jgi:hypothetical protein
VRNLTAESSWRHCSALLCGFSRNRRSGLTDSSGPVYKLWDCPESGSPKIQRTSVSSGAPIPNQPSHPNLQVDPSRTGSRAFFAYDIIDPRFFIEASIRSERGENILSFIVVAQLRDGTRGRLRGTEFFNAMMDHFGDSAVDVIEGEWDATNPDWTTNLEEFNRITGSTSLTEAAAATQVPTGLYATRRGYSQATIVAANPAGARGNYSEVRVQFRK